MHDRRKALAWFGAGALGALAAAAARPSAQAPSGQLPVAKDVAPAHQLKRHFPNVPLQTHDGRTVRFYDDLVKGRKVLINFIFTTCTRTCPRTTSNLAKVQEMLGERVGKDIFIISISIDPGKDTPAALKAYAEQFQARPGWTFATGKVEDIDDIRRSLGVYDSPDVTQHMGLLTFGNEPEGKWAATPALDTPKNILYYVLRRVDPFKYTAWPPAPVK